MSYEVLLLGQLEWNLPLFLFLVGIALIYSYLLKYYTTIRLYKKRPILFFLALWLLYIILGSPISGISHLSFSSHMLQMSILYFIIPLLILAGIPERLFELTSKILMMKKVSKLFLTPKLALFLFSLLFLLYHLPVVLTFVSQTTIMQYAYLFLMFILSFSMWWPIVSPDPKQRFYKEQKKRYIFLSGLLLMPACIVLILNALIDGVQNPFLNQITAQLCLPNQTNSLNILPSPFNTKYDQIFAGTLMLGMHKFSLILSARFRNTEIDRLKE